ncbi:hypothetical protein CC80DRAFT_497036 [Byssothecium circinans]|uniref:Uncharacterized protein n=1 Tax=Byssothecium circinans TaxID=147558 RepID=A0A6A5TBQ4_9PLEO|nr:hypothetical protein CC80DRAFT_497036 [Byssothecium circinans]
MSADRKEYIDITAQDDPQNTSTPLSKAEEAAVEHGSGPSEEEDTPPPSYSAPDPSSTTPPQSPTPEEDVRASIQLLRDGDPQETIHVPMIHSVETRNYKKLLSKDRKTVTRTVMVRKMPREHYLKHYAKDPEGNYVGTGKPAADAGLVFVPSKSTPEDILEQVRKVAFGKMHDPGDFGAGAGMAGGSGG